MHVHIPSSHMTKEARRQLSREVKLEVKKEFMRTKIENAKRIDAIKLREATGIDIDELYKQEGIG